MSEKAVRCGWAGSFAAGKEDLTRCVTVFYCCSNKLSQVWLLKTTYSLKVMEAKRPKWVSLGYNQGVGRAVFLLKVLGESLLPCLCHSRGAARTSWLIVPAFTFKAGSITSSNPSLTLTLLSPSFFFFFFICTFERESARACASRGRGIKRGRQADSPLSRDLDMGLNPGT